MDEHGMREDMAGFGGHNARETLRDEMPPPPTGKPYRWQIEQAERPEIVALPLEAIATPLSHAVAFRQNIVERMAALLIVVSRNNGYEGRDRVVITDDLSCGVVADLLGVDIDLLGHALLDLEARGLVARAADGSLHIDDPGGLDRLSDGR